MLLGRENGSIVVIVRADKLGTGDFGQSKRLGSLVDASATKAEDHLIVVMRDKIMRRTYGLINLVASLLLVASAARGQDSPVRDLPPLPPSVPAGEMAPAGLPAFEPIQDPGPAESSFGLESGSLPGEISENIAAPSRFRMGATAVSEVGILRDFFGLSDVFSRANLRAFGWVEAGYSAASPGAGLLSIEPRLNRFGNEFLMNEIGLTFQKALEQDRFNLGFMVRYFAGADAALGAAKGGIGDPAKNGHFGQDFRDLYLSAHLPILTDGGVDFQIGRMNTIIGYNGFLAPYRPFYSSDYQFFYSQDGAFTGFLTNLHVNKRLDIWNGMTLGANTFFVNRSANSYCYIGQVNYWVQEERRTRLTASVYAGPNAIFAAPGLAGDFVTMVELRLQQDWTQRFTQVFQNNMGWDANTPVGTGAWYGLYNINIFHATSTLDLNSRFEWFDDVHGTRTGVSTDYCEVTMGMNWHPTRFLEVRPEIRGDFAGAPAYGINGAHTYHSQLSGGISFVVKF